MVRLRSVHGARDMRQQVASHQALRQSEERYRTAVAAIADGIVLQDATGMIIAVNAGAERIAGISGGELLGFSFRDPNWDFIHEDGTPLTEVRPKRDLFRARALELEPRLDEVLGEHAAAHEEVAVGVEGV